MTCPTPARIRLPAGAAARAGVGTPAETAAPPASRPPDGDCVRHGARVSFEGDRTVRSGQGVTAVGAPLHSPARRTFRPALPPALRAAFSAAIAAPAESRRSFQLSFHPADVRTLVTRGPLVHLYGRQHIDLQRVAGALCCG